MAEITKEFRFEASHTLPGHEGKCRFMHGHSYLVEITLQGPIKNRDKEEDFDSDDGMVADFAVLDEFEDYIDERFDHAHLNEVIDRRPTAENIGVYLFEIAMNSLIRKDVKVKSITVWETSKSRATVYLEDVADENIGEQE